MLPVNFHIGAREGGGVVEGDAVHLQVSLCTGTVGLGYSLIPISIHVQNNISVST